MNPIYLRFLVAGVRSMPRQGPQLSVAELPLDAYLLLPPDVRRKLEGYWLEGRPERSMAWKISRSQ